MKQNNFISLYLNPQLSLSQISGGQFSEKERLLLSAKTQMLQGKFLLAASIFQQKPLEGDLLAQVDLLACLYQAGDFYRWNKEVVKIDPDEFLHTIRSSEYHEMESSLAYMVSKFMEEAGFIAESLQLLEQIIGFDEPIYLAAQLRICTQYMIPKKNIHEIYDQLLLAHQSGLTQNYFFEVQQALTLYEAYNIDLQLALLRFENTLSGFPALAQDLSLIYIDLLETSMFNGQINEDLIEKCKKLESLNLFEFELLNLAQAKLNREWPAFLTKMSKSNSLRLFKVMFLRKEFKNQKEVAAFSHRIVSGFSDRNRRIWNLFLKLADQADEVEVHLFQDKIIRNEKKIHISDLIYKLLGCFSDQGFELDSDQLIDNLWAEEPSLHNYDRLKTLIARANKNLEKAAAIEKAITFSRQKITLSPRLKIKAS